MIPVEQITEQELERRMRGLPARLQDALSSGSVLLAVDQICRNHHLVDEERVLMVRQIVAIALFGFIHSYDISREINESLALNNPKLADSIARELEAKIFAPLKSELEATYEPLAQKAAAAQAAPMSISEIGKSGLPIIDLEVKPKEPAPQSVKPAVKSVTEVVKPSSAPATPAPTPLVGVLTPQLKPATSVTPAPKPLTATPIVAQRPAAPAAPPSRPVFSAGGGSAFDRETLPQKEKIPAPLGKEASIVSPQPPKPAEPAPTPFFIHKETQLEPVKPGSDFRLEFLTPKFKDVKAGAGTPPSGAAELVIGEKSGEKKPGAKQTELAPPRVVHYSQWKTPVGPSAPAPEKKNEGPAPVMLSHAGGAPLRDISSAAKPQPAVPPPVRAAGTTPPPPPPVRPVEVKPPIPPAPAPRPLQPAPPPRPTIPPPQPPSPPPTPSAQEKKPIPTPQPPVPPRPALIPPPTPPKPPTPQPPLSPTSPAPAPEKKIMPPPPTPPPAPPSVQKPAHGEEVIDLGAL